MIFCGEKENGFFAKEYCENLMYVEPCNTIDEQVRNILALGDTDYTIFDISQYDTDAEKIAETIKLICKNNNSQPIIYAVPYSEYTTKLNIFFKAGFKDFVTAPTLQGMKTQFEHCLSGYNHSVTYTEFSALKTDEDKVKKIGVMGTQRRIGTTTYALQLVKYFQKNGYKACYIEANETKYLMDLMRAYNIADFDEKYGRIQYDNIDHYELSDMLNEIVDLYDYAVFDFGCMDEAYYRDLYLEMNKKICVAGTGVSETSLTLKILDNPFYRNVDYILNYSNINEAAIKNIFSNQNNYYINNSYIPNGYKLEDESLYQKLIPVKNLNPDEQIRSNKKSFFANLFSNSKEKALYEIAIDEQS